ncbi:HAD family hydrolase [Williamsia sp. CHRR-6]|uniref:HAD family hydrolase n=1 Tax=Williamsia sp. CHRR-6 TaxID=2835871 RepID=UPI001BD9FD62|nr:HAD family hydrolase [Williamsia sp. CHRR-6]MBT0567211.1 HAD hydrolase-like protein [Williamsia sp. CHRR-6]
MIDRPLVAFLDVNETLSDLDSLTPAFEAAGLNAADVYPWYLAVLRDGFAATVLGDCPRFADLGAQVAAARIRAVAEGLSDDEIATAAADLMSGFLRAQPHPDVVSGLVALADAGVRVVTLSNGSAAVARALFESTAAATVVEEYLSVDDAGAWKPSPVAYRHGLGWAGIDAADGLMVAVHPWDLEGARRVGLRTAWINRHGAVYPAGFTTPDIEATSFDDLARILTDGPTPQV